MQYFCAKFLIYIFEKVLITETAKIVTKLNFCIFDLELSGIAEKVSVAKFENSRISGLLEQFSCSNYNSKI